MLVLTRSVGEALVMGTEDTINLNPGIRVEVLGISGQSVQLGFYVNPEVRVLREELLRRGPRRRVPKGAPKSRREEDDEGVSRSPTQPKVYYKQKKNYQVY